MKEGKRMRSYMRTVKWSVMLSIFVVIFVVFEIIIHLKQQEQNDNAYSCNKMEWIWKAVFVVK